jgi:hypothetical protein
MEDREQRRRRWRDLVEDRPEVHRERYWPAYLSVAVAVALQLVAPPTEVPGPHLLIPAVETALLAALAAGRYLHPHRREPEVMLALRGLSLALIAFTTLGNLVALGALVDGVLGGRFEDGRTLALAGLAIWTTNVVVFALWFWEMDGGGAVRRRSEAVEIAADLQFPQMTAPDYRPGDPDRWMPDFVDYLYVAYTNATAFSPTDTMPLSQRAKLAMLVQSAAALATVALVAARAVNLLR